MDLNRGGPEDQPRFIAHRGGGASAPENTLAAIRMAAVRGFRAVEFDVMLSRDGMPVLIHDETLERTTNGAGRVAECDAAVLCRLDAGSWFSGEFAGEPLPVFAEAILLCSRLGLFANVEIKPSSGQDEVTAERVVTVLREMRVMSQRVLLSSFSVAALKAAQHHGPAFPRALLVDALEDGGLRQVQALQACALHVSREALRDEGLSAVTKTLPVRVYTVNDPAEARLAFKLGVRAVFTDDLSLPWRL